ncbi:MAG TPA: hypothetical protein VFJ94_10790 [Intrasporangium sp.]|uniref:hypothetical protein n=1 Tax=Intrasporangium sp. TaxID=1925024 RepID=UPI002D7698C5|nr:hypothetical protein [Intrasporangium sp.]HET7398997.1 hypothetical protein [Intrasporangium sp.]
MSDPVADDQPLSAAPPQAAAAAFGIVDSTPPLDPATFDLDDFIAGMRPTRRTVKIHERGDLIGVMDEIVDRIDSTPEDQDVNDLIAAYEQAKQAFLAHTAYWTVEKRSSEWVTDRWATYARANGLTLDKDGDTTDMKARLRLLIDQLVGQVVEVKPAGGAPVPVQVTHERLRRMYDANEGELNKLMYAMTDANQAVAQSARVLTRDFSQRSSTGRSGTASS